MLSSQTECIIISTSNAIKLIDVEPLDVVVDCLEKIELSSGNSVFSAKVHVCNSALTFKIVRSN